MTNFIQELSSVVQEHNLSEEVLYKLRKAFLDSSFKVEDSAPEIATDLIDSEQIEKTMENVKHFTISHVPIGFNVLDEAMGGGVESGSLNVVTGHTGFGKTSTVQQIAFNLSNQNYHPLFFSFEVSIQHLYKKFKEMGYSDNKTMFVPLDQKNGNINYISKVIENHIKKYQKVGAIFIDHLDSLVPTKALRDNMEANYIKAVVMELKEIANKTQVPIFLVAHLSKIEDRMPTKQDLKGSSSIQQWADNIFIIHRLPKKKGDSKQTSGYSRQGYNPTDEEFLSEILFEGNTDVYSNYTVIKQDKNRSNGKCTQQVVEMKGGKFVPVNKP